MSDENRSQESEPELRKSCGADDAKARANRRRSGGLVGIFAAVGAAALSSSCFWLPIVLVAGGASAAGTAGAVDAFRIPAMIITGALLAGGFYLLYIRKPANACSPAQQRARKVSRVALWAGAVFAIAFIAFPDQVARALPGSQAQAASFDDGEPDVRSYKLDGMHSPACAGVAERILADVPGVGSTAVYYEDGKVKVKPREGEKITDEDVLQAFADSPFTATPLTQ